MATRLASSEIWSDSRKNYVLAVMAIATVFNQIDRQILPVLLQSIKKEFSASDTSMGLLTGVYFVVFYVVAGIPIARLADIGNRRRIITACIATCSAATVLSGLAQSYIQMAVVRMFVPVGEGGSAPAIWSLLSDIFPVRVRARVFGIVSSGNAIGLGFGILVAGTLHELLGWRMVFIVVGLPGLLVAALVLFTLPEPRHLVLNRGNPRPSLLSSLKTFWRIPSYRALAFIAFGASSTGYAALAWIPTFLIRVHGMSTGQVGLEMGGATVIGLWLGNVGSGFLADRLVQRSPRWLIWVAALGLFASVPMGFVVAFAHSREVTIVAFGLFIFCTGFWGPPVFTCAIGIVGSQSRALVTATIPFFQSLGGFLGPFLIGMMNDSFSGLVGGQTAMRYSIAASTLGSCLAGGVCLLMTKALLKDYRANEIVC